MQYWRWELLEIFWYGKIEKLKYSSRFTCFVTRHRATAAIAATAATAAALIYARSLSIIVDINVSTNGTIWERSREVYYLTGKMTGDR